MIKKKQVWMEIKMKKTKQNRSLDKKIDKGIREKS